MGSIHASFYQCVKIKYTYNFLKCEFCYFVFICDDKSLRYGFVVGKVLLLASPSRTRLEVNNLNKYVIQHYVTDYRYVILTIG